MVYITALNNSDNLPS